jgi:hypothetical protein
MIPGEPELTFPSSDPTANKSSKGEMMKSVIAREVGMIVSG